MKKIISLILSVCMALQVMTITSAAVEIDLTSLIISVGSADVMTGETFTLPVRIEQNPGIISTEIVFKYDENYLELISVEDCGLLKGAECLITEPDSENEYFKMMWDDIDNHNETGVLANLTFRAKERLTDKPVYVEAKPTYTKTLDTDLKYVSNDVYAGNVNISLNPETPLVICDTVFGVGGDELDVPIYMYNNPGLAAIKLRIKYDPEGLELLDITDGKILGDSTFTKSNPITEYDYLTSYYLMWDDIGDKDNTGNGVLATLRFKVLYKPEFNGNISIWLEQSSTINSDLEEVPFAKIDGGIFSPSLEDLIYNGERKPLDYRISADSPAYNVKADVSYVENENIQFSSFTNDTSYNNGFGFINNSDALHEFRGNDNKKYISYSCGSTALIFSEDISKQPLLLDSKMINEDEHVGAIGKADWEFGAAAVDEKGYIYALWGQPLTDEEAKDKNFGSNIVLAKYDASGKYINAAGVKIEYTNALVPFTAGNAALGIKDGIAFAAFDTLWRKSSDGLNHQGSCCAAFNIETMSCFNASSWEGSHSFGISMIPTSYGFSLIEMGDASSRGIVMNHYGIFHGKFYNEGAFGGRNGSRVVYNASGSYGSNEEHVDGNYTFTHMGGMAKSSTTFAVAGKSEREYTSKPHDSSKAATNIYDVFVRVIDQEFKEKNDLAGESRKDADTGLISDKNVIWLTNCDDNEKAGAVKIVTLDDGAYCVLWERFTGGEFDSVRYVILDECGNILRPESKIEGARLSDISTQPFVDEYKLTWVVSYGDENKLAWYSADLAENSGDTTTTTTTTTSTTTTSNSTTSTTTTSNSTTSTTTASKSTTSTTTTSKFTTSTTTTSKSTTSTTTTSKSTTSTTTTSKSTTSTTTTSNSTTSTTTTTTTPDGSEPKLGDVNKDGIINAVDASRILIFYAALNAGETEVTENDIAVCDLNGDTMINAVDASLVLAYYANLNADQSLTLEAFLADKIKKK